MQSGFGFFSEKKEKEIDDLYTKLKEMFIEHLHNTASRCAALCGTTYDQERFFMVAANPEIDEKITKGKRAIERIEEEIKSIDAIQNLPLKRISNLMLYAEGLASTDFNLLFMKIFSGKLKKYWLPDAKKLLEPYADELKEIRDHPVEWQHKHESS